MSTTKVNIRSKQIGSIVDTDLAARLYANKGTRVMAIVELKVDETHEKVDGDRKVDLLIDAIEPVIADGKTGLVADEHIRTLQQALYRNRMLAQGVTEELPFGEEDGPAPKVADVVTQGKALTETDDDGNVVGLFDKDKAEMQPV